MKPRQLSKRVKPRSKQSIRGLAYGVRQVFGIKADYFPIVKALEILAFPDDDFFDLEVVEDNELPREEALTIPDNNRILIRESVYNGACDGDGRSRFTLAHELGHFIMHRGIPASYGRSTNHKIYEDSEWQADRFASELLIPRSTLKVGDTHMNLIERYGVSWQAADIALKELREKAKGHP